MKKAFTMIELIFVIVILGILSSVAISKMAVTRDDAEIAKGRAQIASIRNAIILARNTSMLQGNGASWPDALDDTGNTSTDGDPLFDGNATLSILDYPLYSKDSNGHWRKTAATTYAYKVVDIDIPFTYTVGTGQFDCVHDDPNANIKRYCKALTE
ncbi:MAG: type II secretion system GspH family protein [Epsilonproteobacteria bacterium]|nr:type II secretion system GspH family protein [Campylobacterota bacterium]